MLTLTLNLTLTQEGFAEGAGAEDEFIAKATTALAASAPALKAKGVRLVSLIVPTASNRPRQFSFPLSKEYADDPQPHLSHSDHPHKFRISCPS